MTDFNCVDCQVDTSEICEYYMLHNDLWASLNCSSGMLCIGCVESRLGRELTREDFNEALINRGIMKQSDRLRDRLQQKGMR